jgi:HSP20 family molecular chaperone IbpA
MRNNTLPLFDRIPQLFPTPFEQTLMSGNIFDEFTKMFNSQKLRQMTVYPTDIYNEIINDKVIATVIEVAIAGVKKEHCSIKLEGNKLQVAIGVEKSENTIEEIPEKKKSKKTAELVEEPVIIKDYIQQQISERTAYINWTISNRVEKDKIEVSCTDGILKIRLPLLHEIPEPVKIFEIK